MAFFLWFQWSASGEYIYILTSKSDSHSKWLSVESRLWAKLCNQSNNGNNNKMKRDKEKMAEERNV